MKITMTNANVFDTDNLLLALVPTLGPRAAISATLCELKWAGSAPLKVERSTLEFIDDKGEVIGRQERAFGFEPGTELVATSQSCIDENHRPAGLLQRWRLNDWVVESPIVVPEAEWGNLHVIWLPLQLPLVTDVHIVVSLANLDDKPLDIARGVREAVCWVDGVPWSSAAGGVWNTRYLIEPGHSTRRHFRLADFPGVPTAGRHEMSFQMLGRRSKPQFIQWHGTPWCGTSELV
jgi:hypothetical protein